MATTETSRLLTLRETAGLLGISEATLYRWRHEGVGPPGYRLMGGVVRFRRAAIEAWLEQQADRPR